MAERPIASDLKSEVPQGTQGSNTCASSIFRKQIIMLEHYLFLDDERNPGDVTWCNLPSAKYIVVRNYNEFVQHVLSFGIPEFVSFDHDLADMHYAVGVRDAQLNSTGQLAFAVAEKIVDVDYGPEKTGYDCAKWLVDFCTDRDAKFPDYIVHSMNPVGSMRIKQYVENAKKHLNI